MPSSYDMNTPSEPIRILRSALPYLEHGVQHQVNLALKCMELQDILQSPLSSDENRSLMRGGEEAEENSSSIFDRRLRMLQSIRGACDPEHIGYVDTVIQTFRMQSMIQQVPQRQTDSADTPVIPFLRKSKAEDNSPVPNHETALENQLKSMLSPQQQALFQPCSQILKQPEKIETDLKKEAAHG